MNLQSDNHPEITEISIRGIGACTSCMGCSREMKLEKGQFYIAKTENGEEIVRALFNSRPSSQIKSNLEETLTILRELSENDWNILKDRQRRESKIRSEIKEKVEIYDLDMKVTNVEFNHDESIIYCYYTAPQRVDFRELVRDLGHIYKKRIEMKQIGARDESRMLGGCAHCGMQICCNGVFRVSKLPNISMKMAKIQNLASNPQNLLGMCGKLRCCIEFEFKNYFEGPDESPVPEELLKIANTKN